jgi:DNA polymerase-3 subunit alpha
MIAGLEKAMQIGAGTQADKQKGQMNFFGQTAQEPDYTHDVQRLPKINPWPEAMMLNYEKEVLGFYVTSNPLSHFAETINFYSTANTSGLEEVGQDRAIVIGGMVAKIRYHITQKGRNAGAKMAVFVLEDLQGQVEVVLFPDALNKYTDYIDEDKIIFVKGRVDFRREKPNILAEEIFGLDEATEKLASKVRIKLDAKDITKEKVAEIKSICQSHRGKSPVYIAVRTDKGRVYAAADRALSVNPDVEFCRKMQQLVGEENFQLAK